MIIFFDEEHLLDLFLTCTNFMIKHKKIGKRKKNNNKTGIVITSNVNGTKKKEKRKQQICFHSTIPSIFYNFHEKRMI